MEADFDPLTSSRRDERVDLMDRRSSTPLGKKGNDQDWAVVTDTMFPVPVIAEKKFGVNVHPKVTCIVMSDRFSIARAWATDGRAPENDVVLDSESPLIELSQPFGSVEELQQGHPCGNAPGR